MTALIPLALAAASPVACAVTGPLAATLCADPFLIGMDAELTALSEDARRKGARPASTAQKLARFRARLEAGYDAYDGSPRRPFTSEELKQEYESEIAALKEELRRDASVSRADPRERFNKDCLAGAMKGCRVEAAGWTIGRDGTRILWQIQSGATDSDGVGAGILLWDGSRPGAPVPIGWSFEGVDYRPPRLNLDGPEPVLWATGTRAGTASWNADILYARREGRWVEIEGESWRDALPHRLPKGLGVWKGVEFDPMGMSGSSDLWREDDANCCPTGGRAYFDFAIEGTSLTLTDVNVRQSEAMIAPRP